MVGVATTIIGSTTSNPLLESSTTTLTPTYETVSEAEESPDSPVPTNPPSMFSTSMAPPRPTLAGQEEELITAVAPTITEEHEDTDDVTAAEPQNTTESTDTTRSASKPFKEPGDHSVTEISTIQPDVPIPEASLNTEPMFEESIPDSGITTPVASDLTDNPKELTELTSKELFSSSESTPSVTGFHSTTPFPDYGPSDIETGFAVEGLPPSQPSIIPTDTTFMYNTQSGSKVEITTTTILPETTSTATQTAPQMQAVETMAVVYMEETTSAAVTTTAVLTDSGTSAEDVTSSSSVHVFEESTTEWPAHSYDTLTKDEDTATEIGTEFFTSAPMVSVVADTTTTPGTAVADEQSVQVTTVRPMQNVSGKTYKQ